MKLLPGLPVTHSEITADGKNKITFKIEACSRLKDPYSHYIEELMFYCPVEDLPYPIFRDANVRPTNVDQKLYKKIGSTLVSESEFFHHKNQGITIIAESSFWDEISKTLTVIIAPGQGIVNGGHTHAICVAKRGEIEPAVRQSVKIFIKTRIPASLIPAIAEGQNSSLQVKETSLMNHRGEFDWIKDCLRERPYASLISYAENEKKPIKISRIVRFLVTFDLEEFPINGKEMPMKAYSSEKTNLKSYEKGEDKESGKNRFQKFANVLDDILHLSDFCISEAKSSYNRYSKGRSKAACLAVLGRNKNKEGDKNDKQPLCFSKSAVEMVEFGLIDAALYPIMAAFRSLLVLDKKSGMYQWIAPFDSIKDFVREELGPMVDLAEDASKQGGDNQRVLGGNKLLWSTLQNHVKGNLYKLNNLSQSA